jgi:glucose-1-phosphate thymidylyltransferase
MKLLVLAAGYATRLRPLTDNQPKPLLPVGGRPMIDHVLDRFHGCAEIDEVYVVTNHRFAPHFEAWAATAASRHSSWRFRVVDDGTTSNEDRLGAIGDIHFVIDRVSLDDDLIIVAGDNLFTEPLGDYVRQAGQLGILIGVYDVGDLAAIRQYNNITVDAAQRITHFEEKPQTPRSTLTAIALYHYPRLVLPLIRRYLAEGNNPDQPGRLVQWLYPQLPCYAYPIAGRWLDIGSRESYDAAQLLLAPPTLL